jgi:hypothetical protein
MSCASGVPHIDAYPISREAAKWSGTSKYPTGGNDSTGSQQSKDLEKKMDDLKPVPNSEEVPNREEVIADIQSQIGDKSWFSVNARRALTTNINPSLGLSLARLHAGCLH